MYGGVKLHDLTQVQVEQRNLSSFLFLTALLELRPAAVLGSRESVRIPRCAESAAADRRRRPLTVPICSVVPLGAEWSSSV